MSQWWRPSSTSEEPEDRVKTRRQTAAASADDAPSTSHNSRGRDTARFLTPQERVRSHSRGRTPSSSPLPTSRNAFNTLDDAAHPPAMDPELIRQITADAVRMALAQDREERDRQSRIATEAAVSAALANQTSQVQALRRPDLPPFDRDHIEVWIRRIEFAYARSNITRPTDKFAFLEKMFHAKDDSKINAFLWGQHDEDTWTDFTTYLKERYGRTKKQEVYSLLDGVSRDGRRPTALAELIKELTPTITVDDIRKEVLLKQIPATVRQHISNKVDDLDFMGTAAACDKYFDNDGKLKESQAAPINHIGNLRQSRPPQQQTQQQPIQQPTSSSTTPPSTDDNSESEVNAVRFQNGQPRSFSISNRSSSRGGSSFNSSSSNNSNSQRYSTSRPGGAGSSSSSSNPPSNQKVCRNYIRHGEQAYSCEGSWCILKDKLAPKGQASRM